jgi:hypothetical protein
MRKIDDVISALVNPIHPNTLKERRVRLGLSRVALARIFGVDPASVYRHERGDGDRHRRGIRVGDFRGIDCRDERGTRTRRHNICLTSGDDFPPPFDEGSAALLFATQIRSLQLPGAENWICPPCVRPVPERVAAPRPTYLITRTGLPSMKPRMFSTMSGK